MFADDTTVYYWCQDLDQLLLDFDVDFSKLAEWIDHNQLTVNWSKTKFMILTNKQIPKKNSLVLCNIEIEVVENFKLLGFNVDQKLSFQNHVDHVVKSVNCKLFSFKKMFFLSQNVKTQFFKTFIMPHFDYCASLHVYFSKSVINQLERLYNSCIFRLLNIKLKFIDTVDQLLVLKPLNLFPYKFRIFYRLSLFSHKIMNDEILANIKEGLVDHSSRDIDDNTRIMRSQTSTSKFYKESIIYCVPKTSAVRGESCISVFLPISINSVYRNTLNLKFVDFIG